MTMDEAVNIPKIYTAIAEWMSVLTVLLVYRRLIRREKKSLWLIPLLALSYWLIRSIQHYCETATGIFWPLGMICAVLVMLLTIKLALGLDLRTSAYICTRAFIWAELAASLEWQVFFYYTFARDDVMKAKPALVFAIAFFVAVYALFYLAERHALPEDLTGAALHVRWFDVITSGLIALSLFILSNLSYVLHGSNPFIGDTAPDIFYIRTLSDVVGVISLQLFHVQKLEQIRSQEAAAMRYILRNQYTQYRASRDNIEMVNRKYHDLKHQLQLLKMESSDRTRSDYIDELESELARYDAAFSTGNPTLDTLLTAKQVRCLKENITLTVVADGTLLDHMKAMDLCAVFGNALDNCIEHVLRIPEADHRLIHLTVSERNSFICILVENYYIGKDIKDGTLPATTKANTDYHGYGLKSIKYTIEQYGGYINTSVVDHWFRLEMLMPREA